MFNCQICGETQPPRTPCTLVTVEERQKTYPARPIIYPPEIVKIKRLHNIPFRLDRRITAEQKEERRWLPDPGGSGREIAREIRVCPGCAERIPSRKLRNARMNESGV